MPTYTRHRIQFPPREADHLSQDKAFFDLIEDGSKRRLRFHDYDEIYKVPGLYEQLFYDRLKCQSPAKVAEILEHSVAQSREQFTQLRVLDLGAGNGMMGEALKKYGVSRLVGVDIIPEAKTAAVRDRPGLYDAYYVADFCQLTDDQRDDLTQWSFDCLTTVAALGFGDIPPQAFITAFNMVQDEGWVAFNIKETFLELSDTSGFSQVIRQLVFSEFFKLYRLERYRHRISIDGEPVYYFAIAGRKHAPVTPEFAAQFGC